MSSESQPISPARFAEALRELPASTLAIKVLELRNSIAHLDYSNAELKPFAEGHAPTLEQQQTGAAAGQPDQDCVDAIAENEAVIARMQERIELIKAEVEARGLSWREFQGKADEDEGDGDGEKAPAAADASSASSVPNGTVNGHGPAGPQTEQQEQHPAWSDGTFQIGTVGQLQEVDQELLRRLQSRIPPENGEEGDGPEGGVYL
ncbi:hypothetical protein GGS23DRAFT_82345 [Durotheca rogersii]|uniref:uncharacterized protein n=1 Tax=Durotheca rogersii TaxID=419775 RepID=UPI00221F4C99|nr:uncharacterized protein GGS23DRAFT_82345 [Durotheca rogersii]KAI5862570.1 hypothetical protein GGS23DRAFT_82345 [Durotheca rogersii]